MLVGDLILVNKFHYGIRLPVINRKIIANHDPQRGDVMVFRYPKDTSIDYIKRVVGVPGDEVSFRAQQLYINGTAVPMEPTPPPGFYDEESRRYFAAVQGDSSAAWSTPSSSTRRASRITVRTTRSRFRFARTADTVRKA